MRIRILFIMPEINLVNNYYIYLKFDRRGLLDHAPQIVPSIGRQGYLNIIMIAIFTTNSIISS